MNDDTLILRRTALTEEHLGCPIRGCTFIVEVPAVPVNGHVAAVFGMSGKTMASLHAELDAARAADTMRQHLRIHPPEDWLQLLEHTAMIVEVRSDRDEVESLSGIAAAALAARNAAETEAEQLRAQVRRVREACHADSFAVDDTYRFGYATAQKGVLRALDGGDAVNAVSER